MEEELDEVEEGKLDWRKAVAEFDDRFRKDRDQALKKMVSVKAGLAVRRREEAPARRPAPGGARGHVPEERRRAAPPDGEERPLRRLRRLPRLRLHRRHARARGGRGRRLRARRADVRGVRQPDEAPDGARRLVVPRLHGLSELPQHGRREGGEREGRGASRPPHRREVPRSAGTTWRRSTAATATTSAARTTRPAATGRPSRSPRRPSPARSAGRARSSSARGGSGRSTAARTTPPARRTSARDRCRRRARRAPPPTSS